MDIWQAHFVTLDIPTGGGVEACTCSNFQARLFSHISDPGLKNKTITEGLAVDVRSLIHVDREKSKGAETFR